MRNIIITVLLFTSYAFSAEEEPAPLAVTEAPSGIETDVSRISEAFGHFVAHNITGMDFRFDMPCFIKGLEDATAGKDSPMTEEECFKALTAAREAAFKQIAMNNLKKATEFLAKNATGPQVVVLEENKLQYKIEKTGQGESVENNSSPLVEYTGSYSDGTIFAHSQEGERLSLDEGIIPGLSRGILGMKEGEERSIYIHPDLGYGEHGPMPPNSLLTFKIKIVKAHAPDAPEPNLISTKVVGEHSDDHSAEIATPAEQHAVLR